MVTVLVLEAYYWRKDPSACRMEGIFFGTNSDKFTNSNNCESRERKEL